MSRLIDAEAITDHEIIDYLGIRYASCLDDVRDMLNDQPTIEATPVMHSRWELVAWHKGIKVCKCLNCNKTQLGNTPLCGHCGADMREGD